MNEPKQAKGEVPIICPSCGACRPTKAQYEAVLAAEPGAMDAWELANKNNRCCNPRCGGNWGTGCHHCHHPRFLRGWTPVWPTDEGRYWLWDGKDVAACRAMMSGTTLLFFADGLPIFDRSNTLTRFRPMDVPSPPEVSDAS